MIIRSFTNNTLLIPYYFLKKPYFPISINIDIASKLPVDAYKNTRH